MLFTIIESVCAVICFCLLLLVNVAMMNYLHFRHVGSNQSLSCDRTVNGTLMGVMKALGWVIMVTLATYLIYTFWHGFYVWVFSIVGHQFNYSYYFVPQWVFIVASVIFYIVNVDDYDFSGFFIIVFPMITPFISTLGFTN